MVREQRLANGFVDFDRAVADRVNPCRMAEGLHLGDGVHPNTEGGILRLRKSCISVLVKGETYENKNGSQKMESGICDKGK